MSKLLAVDRLDRIAIGLHGAAATDAEVPVVREAACTLSGLLSTIDV